MSTIVLPNGLSTFLISAGAVTLLSFGLVWGEKNRKRAARLVAERKLRDEILASPDSSWKKVGSVKEIYYYPLKSGKGKPVEECNFENVGISVSNEEFIPMRDRMLLVYEEKTGKFITGRQHSKLLLVSISAAGEGRVKLEAADMPPLILNIPMLSDPNAKVIKCTLWFGEPVKCLDCGPEASAWISKYLKGSGSDFQLGAWFPKCERFISKGASWEPYAKIYKTIRDEDMGLYSDLSSYMVLSESSVKDLNERLKNPISPLQLRPNIVVEGSDPYAEDEWEWIKVGKDAIIRNVKLCTRCSMVRVDPDTGIPDPSEPLKTLRTYRKLKNPELDALENHAPAIGIYCGLYASGVVKIGDEISVYRPDKQN
ncbi:hypothetical protein TSAR_005445 [Trichomalopsis sarcophagae]|uniref:MOSC domain-containing protein n=1 Tax=Trichomalopsis sarcophagae TaxID=543379 RepID=A0A232F9N4_9HYME|nr:hypothetical protein TSAR_005445 [Trichomalopsis sarcophagae]